MEPEGVGMNGYALPLERIGKLAEKCYDQLERKRLGAAFAHYLQMRECMIALGTVLARMAETPPIPAPAAPSAQEPQP